MLYQRHCLECKEAFSGRVDKKFCSDQCRNTYNNHLYLVDYKVVRRTNAILKKNRHILCELNKGEKTLVSRISLSERGFNFRYVTSFFKTKSGQVFYQCYDHIFVAEGLYHFYILKVKEGGSINDEVFVAELPFEQP